MCIREGNTQNKFRSARFRGGRKPELIIVDTNFSGSGPIKLNNTRVSIKREFRDTKKPLFKGKRAAKLGLKFVHKGREYTKQI